MALEYYLRSYLRERPLFLSLIRAKEAELYQKYIPLKTPVLDVGCGDGFFAAVTFSEQHGFSRIEDGSKRIRKSKQAFIDVGLDVKDSRVEEGRKLGIYKKIVIYDGQKIPFPDNSFGTVVSNCVLEHIPDLDLTLKEIKRVLKPGGLFLTTVATKNWEEYLFGNIILGEKYKNWMRKKQVHFNLLTPDGWKSKFVKAGLKTIEAIGYLDKKAVQAIDIFHYTSVSSLIYYKMTKKWIIWPGKTELFPLKFLTGMVSTDLPPESAGNVFYTLKK